MDMFFDGTKSERSPRVASIVENLAHSLVELRVDTMYDSTGEFQTDSFVTDRAKISELPSNNSQCQAADNF